MRFRIFVLAGFVLLMLNILQVCIDIYFARAVQTGYWVDPGTKI